MKKGMLFVGALVAITFASCKKEYTCECTYKDVNGNNATVSATSGKIKKKDAEAWCNTTASTGGSTYTCKLK